MADNVIHLKIVIDGKEVSAELKEADKLLGNLKKNTGGVAGESKKLGDVSKKDLGRFTGELLNAVGATGKLGSHLNNLATGLAMGGMIGVAFAGASALINALVENTQKWSEALKTATNQLIEIKDPLQNLKFKIDPGNLDELIRELEGGILEAQMQRTAGGGSNIFSDLWSSITGSKSEGEEAAEKILEKLEEELIALKAKKVVSDLMNRLLKDENKEWDAQGKTIEEIKEQIAVLEKDLGKTVYQSKQYYKILSDIKKLQSSIGLGEKKEARPDVPEIDVKTWDFEENDMLAYDVLIGSNYLDYMRLTKKQELELWYSTEKKKIEAYINSDEMMMLLDMENARRKRDLAEEEKKLADEVAQTKMEATGNALSFISGATAEHTALHKVASAAQATISTYTAAVEALKAGPILGPIFAAIITGLGMANVAKILSTETPKATGYATGGFAMFGERGPEIIAPVTDYAKGQALLVSQTIATIRSMSPLGSLSASGGGNGMQELISEIRSQNVRIENWQRELNFRFKSGEFVSGSNKALAKYNDLKF